MKPLMKPLKILASVLIVLSFLAFAFRGTTAPIEFGNDAARDLTTKSILADRNKTIGQLEDIVKSDINDPGKKDAAMTAMRLLGKLRADDSAPLLVTSLAITDPGKNKISQHTISYPEYYPAVDALIQIGMPGVDAILESVASTDDFKQADHNTKLDRQKIYVRDELRNYVLVTVLGQPAAIALVTDTANNDGAPIEKERLNALLVGLRKYPYVSRYQPWKISTQVIIRLSKPADDYPLLAAPHQIFRVGAPLGFIAFERQMLRANL